jgi:hypothetical protein
MKSFASPNRSYNVARLAYRHSSKNAMPVPITTSGQTQAVLS